MRKPDQNQHSTRGIEGVSRLNRRTLAALGGGELVLVGTKIVDGWTVLCYDSNGDGRADKFHYLTRLGTNHR